MFRKTHKTRFHSLTRVHACVGVATRTCADLRRAAQVLARPQSRSGSLAEAAPAESKHTDTRSLDLSPPPYALTPFGGLLF